MGFLVVIYFLIGIIRTINILKKTSFQRPQMANENPIMYFILSLFIWPYFFALDLYMDYLKNKSRKGK